MLCGHCGATTSDGSHHCAVCHTPDPARVTAAPSAASPAASSAATTAVGAFDPERTVSAPDRDAASRAALGTVLTAGQQFGRRYTIIRLLGAGGMASVYQAWDESLGTAVALKLIRVDAGTPTSELRQMEDRLKRELKLARQVTHPNVVRIHDLGEVDRTLYLTMEYVQGSDLATVLHKEPRVPLPRALALAREIASGLAAAHRAGIVHRDLKPANVMVDGEGHARLMDFGIARSSAAVTINTVPGSIIGTLDYMAPEQARGEPVDERTDVYAFGLILYELLAGGRPRYSAEGGLSGLIVRIEKGPPPLTSVQPDVTPALDRLVNRCLAVDPALRYPSANELLTDLESLDQRGHARIEPQGPTSSWPAAIAALGALVIAVTWWLASSRTPPAPAAARPPLPILIVDFENRAGETVFEGALEQALSIAIEGAPFITAFPRRDAVTLVTDLKLGSRLDEAAGRLVASREGIPIILAGAIDRSGSGYHVSVRALAADRADALATADASASDKAQVLAAVAQIAEAVREALGDTTPSTSQQAETFTAGSLDAMRAYTLAQNLSSSQKDAEAIVQYREALRHDPEFGRAYSGIGACLLRLGRRDEAEKNWNEALRRTDRMTEREKLRTFGGYYLGIARNYGKAVETYEELVAKYPADSAGYNNLALTHFNLLNFPKALAYGRKAIEVYPKTYKYRSNYALYAMYAGDFETAAATARALIEEEPGVDVPYLPLAMEALAAGDPARARATYQQASQAGESGRSLAAAGRADIDIYEGRHAEAIASLPEAIRRDEAQGNLAGAVAKLVALADAHAARNERGDSQAAITRARALSAEDNVLVTAARLSIAAGRTDEARRIVRELEVRLPAQSRAYARLIEGELAMAAKQYPAAIDAFNGAQKLADLWLIRYHLGLAYFHRGDYPESNSEFEKCRQRRGEATAIFFDDFPTFRYYATVPYWLGRAREMQKLDARLQYQEFLRIRHGASSDPLVDDARRRLGAASNHDRDR